MPPVVTDRVAWCVGLSVTVVSPPERLKVETIEMPFGLWSRMGPRNHVLDGGPDTLMTRGSFEGGTGRPIIKYGP